jgi:hypothetical protein
MAYLRNTRKSHLSFREFTYPPGAVGIAPPPEVAEGNVVFSFWLKDGWLVPVDDGKEEPGTTKELGAAKEPGAANKTKG